MNFEVTTLLKPENKRELAKYLLNEISELVKIEEIKGRIIFDKKFLQAILQELLYQDNENKNHYLKYIDFNGMVFDGIDVRGVNLEGTNANIDPQTVSFKSLEYTNLKGIDLSGKDFTGVTIENTTLENTGALINKDEVKTFKQTEEVVGYYVFDNASETKELKNYITKTLRIKK